MRKILDSGILNETMEHGSPVRERLLHELRRGHHIGVGTPVIGEFQAGLLGARQPTARMLRLRRTLRLVRIWPFDLVAAARYAVIHADLKRRGRMIGAIDMQTAAIAFALGSCVVVTKDADFRAIPGLKTEDWSKP